MGVEENDDASDLRAPTAPDFLSVQHINGGESGSSVLPFRLEGAPGQTASERTDWDEEVKGPNGNLTRGAWERELGCRSVWESEDRDTKSHLPTRNTHPATLSTNQVETTYCTGAHSLLAPLLSTPPPNGLQFSAAVRAPIVTPDEARPSQMVSGDPESRF